MDLFLSVWPLLLVLADASPQCSTPVPPLLRVGCGGQDKVDTADLCAARGCCWTAATTAAAATAATTTSSSSSSSSAPGCLSGSLNTPKAGVHNASWTQHVAFANPAGYKVQIEVSGFVHNGRHGGPGE